MVEIQKINGSDSLRLGIVGRVEKILNFVRLQAGKFKFSTVSISQKSKNLD